MNKPLYNQTLPRVHSYYIQLLLSPARCLFYLTLLNSSPNGNPPDHANPDSDKIIQQNTTISCNRLEIIYLKLCFCLA